MAAVLYKWSEKGKADRCERSAVVIKADTLCYHCGKAIPANEEAVCLRTDREEIFYLHKPCADKSCRHPNK